MIGCFLILFVTKNREINREFEITKEMLSRAYQDLGKDIYVGDDY